MIAQLASAILVFCTLNGSFVPHMWLRGNPQARAYEIAHLTAEVSVDVGVDPWLMLALEARESSFDASRISKAGAFGLVQLNPRFWGREALRLCMIDPINCDYWNLWHGAKALAFYQSKCKSDGRALVAYRTGRCGKVGPEARKVLVLRDRMRKAAES